MQGACKSMKRGGFISEKMFRLVKSEERDRRIKQAAEIKALLFNPLGSSEENPDNEPEEDRIMKELEAAYRGLESTLCRMDVMGQEVQRERPPGLSVPTTHEAIHVHSSRPMRLRWVCITKVSTVDDKGHIGFPASGEEVRRFGHKARKIFLQPPPSELHKSFAEIVRMRREEQRLWKRSVADGDASHGRALEEEARSKRQMGMGAHPQEHGMRNPRGEPRGGGNRNQEDWHGRR
jgi:hypothetical protein